MRSSPLAALALLNLGLVIAHVARSVGAAAEPFAPAALMKMDAEIERSIAAAKLPGAVLWLERHGQRYERAYGQRALQPHSEPMTLETIFDAASLTKVMATTPAVMLLLERGKLKLDEPVRTYLPEFSGGGKEAITLRHLLTHTSGLRAGLSRNPSWSGYDKAIGLACAEEVTGPPGTVFRYSDINFIVLGEVVRRVSGSRLDAFVAREILRPLRMVDSGFLPSTNELKRIAPTEQVGGEWLRGRVHDPTARLMGGVAGHAGLFTTAADLARFARMLLRGGELDGVRILKPETVKLMTSVQSPPEAAVRRGLGWDIDSGYSRPRGETFPLGSYGHTGFTGTSVWLDPFSETFWILLSNRVHPDGQGNILSLQTALGTLAAEAVLDFNFAFVPGALSPRIPDRPAAAGPEHEIGDDFPGVLNGIDVLQRQQFAPLKGLRLGLITNHTGQNRRRQSTVELLRKAPGLRLEALFSPEHGLEGRLDESVGDGIDERTGLPVYSLYGKRRAPEPEQLRALDALVFDMQDIGCRFYTYISTLGLAMEAAARDGVKFFVLDRVNPINGVTVDGPVLSGKTSFVGYHPIPVRHGMTVGELARMFKEERGLKLDLTVIPLEGWKRESLFDANGQPWVNPSPNMRSLTAAILYPGVGLLETTALSVGRGTGTPFEVIGAPYIHDLRLAHELNRAGLAGVRFVPVRFTPTDSVFKGESCGGVNIILTERERCQVVDIGVAVAKVLHRLYPRQFGAEKFDRLLVHPPTLEAIKADLSLAQIRESWAAEAQSFRERRDRFLLYP